MNKQKCTNECYGTIKKIKNNGLEFPSSIYVEYKVDNKIYELKENLCQKKYKNIVLGYIPIGYKTKSLIELKTNKEAKVGNKIRVIYNQENPEEAYLPDNEDNITWN